MYRLTLSGGMWQLLWGTCTFAISLKLGLGQIPLTWYEGESAWNKGNVPAFVQVHWCLRVGLSHPEVEFHIFPQALQVQDLWGSSHRLLYRSPAEGRKLAQCPGEGGGLVRASYGERVVYEPSGQDERGSARSDEEPRLPRLPSPWATASELDVSQ